MPKWMYILIITLNVNVLHAPIKRLTGCTSYKRSTSDLETYWLKVKECKGYSMQMEIKKKAGLAILIIRHNRLQNLKDKQKLKFEHQPTSFTTNVKELETRKLWNEKLFIKSKYTVKVWNHAQTKLLGKLKDQSSKIIKIHSKQLRGT